MSTFHLSVRARLAALLIFTNLFLVAAAGYAWFAISRLNGQLESVIVMEDQVQVVDDLSRQAELEFKEQVQEWKDTLLRGQDPALFQKYSAAFTERATRVTRLLSEIAGKAPALGLPAGITDKALAGQHELERRYAEAIKLYKQDDFSSAQVVDRAVAGLDRPLMAEFAEIAHKVDERRQAMATEIARDAASEKRFLIATLSVLALLTIGLSAAFGGVIITT